jgi:hypothetical protein
MDAERISTTLDPARPAPSWRAVLDSPGRPLDAPARRLMEPRFGFDLGGVRIHDDARAAASAEAVGASAYTVGPHIVFGTGRYGWRTPQERDLLGHELTHVVQQRGAVPVPAALATGTAAAEREADHVSHRLALGSAPSAGISHQPVGLFRFVPGRAAGGAPPAALTGLDRFRQTMARRFLVRDVQVGTQARQEAELTPRGGVPPGGIHIPNWQAWQPTDDELQTIEDAFDDVSQAFDGVPRTSEIIFYAMAYEFSGGVVTPRPDTGASYGGGQLRIYRALTTRPKAVPFARSNVAGNYPGRPVAELTGEPGQSPGAPLPWPSQEESSRRQVVHELGHGLAEAAHGGTNPMLATDPTMLADYQRTVGWVGGHLYDVGVAAVRTAIAAGTPPPAQFEITGNNWNAPTWVEQPISHYSVAGGPGEDFADAVMAYVRSPEVLRARSPRRYEFIQSRRQRWAPGLVPPVSRPGDYPAPAAGTSRAA